MLGFGPIGSMPIGSMETMEALLERGRRTLEQYVGLPDGILTRIASADDWTFVLQIHGLLEAAVDHLIADDLAEPTRSWLLRLDLQSGKGSKVSFGIAHGSLSSADQSFIRALSLLRARFAHDIGMTAVALREYLAKEANKDILNGLLSAAFVAPGMPQARAEQISWLSEHPRETLFLAVSDFISRAFDVSAKHRHGLRTEDGHFLTTEDGRVLVEEARPVNPLRSSQ